MQLVEECRNPNVSDQNRISSFLWMQLLKNVEIPRSVTSIGGRAFRGCSSLENVEIPSSVTSIENVAFSYCSSLENVVIPSSVTIIGNGAFYECSSLCRNLNQHRTGAFPSTMTANFGPFEIPAGTTTITSPYETHIQY